MDLVRSLPCKAMCQQVELLCIYVTVHELCLVRAGAGKFVSEYSKLFFAFSIVVPQFRCEFEKYADTVD